VETVDRLLRNFKDSIVLDELRKGGKVELHFLRENLVLTKDSNSADLIRWDVAIMFSKGYVLMMKDNIMRSMKHKVTQRGIVNHLPCGYLHQNKKGVLDPERAPLVRKMFELYSSGTYSVGMLTEKMEMLGLTNKTTGRPYTKASIHAMLMNQTYYGICKAFGELYMPNIEPIVSYELFQRCQDILQDRNNNPMKLKAQDFLFKRLIKCKVCGSFITFEMKKKKYVYGHCNVCKSLGRNFSYCKNDELEDQVKKILLKVRFSDKIYKILTLELINVINSSSNLGGYELDTLRTQREAVKEQMSRLMDLYLENGVDKVEYNVRLQNLKGKESILKSRMEAFRKELNPFIKLQVMINVL